MQHEAQACVAKSLPLTHDVARGEVCPTRHNDDLRRRVQLFVNSSNLPALRHIQVDVDGGRVVLSGQLQTYYERQLAVEYSRRVAGVLEVIDHLDVRGLAPIAKPAGALQSRRQRAELSYAR